MIFRENLLEQSVELEGFNEEPTYQKAKIRRNKRAINALRSLKSKQAEAFSLANRIEDCRLKQRCSSLWCRVCRSRVAIGLQKRIETHLREAFGDNKDEARKRLVFVTPLMGLAPVQDPKRVRELIKEARKHLHGVKRTFKNIWWQGAFEFEIINVKEFIEHTSLDSAKRKTIIEMLNWDGTNPSLYPTLVLVHAHILVDLKDTTRPDFEERFAKEYSKYSRQILFKSTRNNQSLSNLAFKLGSYPFKDRVQYNLSFDTGAYKNGKYFSNSELGYLVLLYDSMQKNGFKNLLIGS